MALNYTQLAQDIVTGINQSGTTQEVEGFAQGIVEEVQNGSATYGTIPGPHPISGLSGSSMAALVANYSGFPSETPELINFCTAIADNIMATGIVTYTSPIPNPPTIPPELAWNTGGTISGLIGSVMAAAVKAAVGYPNVSTELLGMCTAICDHINDNAEVISGVIS